MHLSYKPTTLSIPPLLLSELCVTFNGIHDKLLKTTTCSPYSRYIHRDLLLLLHAAIRSQRPCKLQRGHTTDKLRITSHLNRFYGCWCCCIAEKTTTTTMTNTKGCLGTKRRQGGRRHPSCWMEEDEVTRPCRYSLYVEETNSIAGIQSTITNAPCCTRPRRDGPREYPKERRNSLRILITVVDERWANKEQEFLAINLGSPSPLHQSQ